MNSAFVLSLFDTGLGAIRSLGRAGIPVLGFDSDPQMPGFKSRYCQSRLCPSPIYQPEELAAYLLAEANTQAEKPVLIPASDAYVLFLSRFRQQLEGSFLFILPPASVLEAMVNKRKQYELAKQFGTPIAQTFYPESMEDVEAIKDQLTYPAFIKPYVGHLWREKFGGSHKGFKIFSPEELRQRYSEIFPTGLEAMVQAIILGPNTNHYKVNVYMSQNGEPLLVFTLRKIRQYPTEFGVGTMVESLRYPELAELGLHFLKSIEYRGIGSIEFKKDDRDGQLKMIELNPRLWQQNIHATDCGMNFPLMEYQDLCGQNPSAITTFREGVRWWDLLADFQSFWEYRKCGELSLPRWISSWIRASSHPLFALDDLGPFFKANEYGLKYLRFPLYVLSHQKRAK